MKKKMSKNSKMKLKRFNTLEEIYSGGILRDGDYHVCSVCGKKYKKENNIKVHFDAQDCFKYYHVFRNTPTEELFYKWYTMSAALSGTVGYTMKKFRTTPQYSGIVTFYNFCMDHKISDMTDYFKFIIHEFRYEPLNSALVHGKTEKMFERYRRNIGKYIDEGKSNKFLEQNKKELKKDTVFALRSLEKGDISYVTLFDEINFNEFVDKLSSLEYERLERFLESVQ